MTLEIATPYSRLFENDGIAMEISKASDCLEVRQYSQDVDYAPRKLFHFDIDILFTWDATTKEYIRSAIADLVDLELVSFSADSCYIQKGDIEKWYQPCGKKFSADELYESASTNLSWLKELVGSSVNIAIENNNYYPTEAYDIVTDGDFLSRIVEKNDIYFLFDIAHALVTAHNRQIGFEKYLDTLPMNRVIQLHISTPDLSSDTVEIDEHEWPNTEIFTTVKNLLSGYSTVKYLTVEYYRDKDILIRSLKELRQLIESQ